MGRPRLAENDVATSERLLTAAQAEFGRAGFDGTRLEDIATAAGIRRPSLLYHFGSKDALYAAAVNQTFARLGEALEAAMQTQGSYRRRFDAVFERYLGFLESEPDLVRLVLRELLDGRGPGQEVLLTAGLPILARIERFVRDEGRGIVRAGLPIRAALLEVVSAAFVRCASGPLRVPLWGKTDRTLDIVHALFFDE